MTTYPHAALAISPHVAIRCDECGHDIHGAYVVDSDDPGHGGGEEVVYCEPCARRYGYGPTLDTPAPPRPCDGQLTIDGREIFDGQPTTRQENHQ